MDESEEQAAIVAFITDRIACGIHARIPGVYSTHNGILNMQYDIYFDLSSEKKTTWLNQVAETLLTHARLHRREITPGSLRMRNRLWLEFELMQPINIM